MAAQSQASALGETWAGLVGETQAAGNDALGDLLSGIEGALGSVFGLLTVADEEIAAAGRRWPDQADMLWHCFSLIQPVNGLDVNADLYRGHARELLGRVATGHDLCEGTAAEVVLAMKEVSLAVPLNTVGTGLYFRMWAAAGMPELTERGGAPYEEIRGSEIDEAEADVRRRLRQPWRAWDPSTVHCQGLHHGEPVSCRFAPAEGQQ